MNRSAPKVKGKMQELQVTQEDLARELGISRQYVGHLINGRRRSGNFERRIATRLGMTWGEAFPPPVPPDN